jgi:cytochrome c oxidase cbb3-type subunit 3
MRARTWLVMGLMLACNEQREPDQTQAGAPPPIGPAVGPVPGPQLNQPLAENPFASDPNARNAGQILFNQYNCAGCHGDHAGGGMGPSLRDSTWLYGASDGQIFASIAEGRAHGMPSWGSKVPEEQLWKLVAYVKTLRTPDEVSPPDQTLPREPVP